MSDRLYVYKTPLSRILEIALILLITIGFALLWQMALPAISSSYLVVALLIFGFTLVPRLGDRLAQRRGAPMMTRAERTRRYLSELGPIGMARSDSYPAFSSGQRRGGGRSLRR
ncbi:MAG TPA: hypothetical protein VM689_18130 [Aliidongia sp.]|nr:hypothetical protein [Aliidongia sp.]